MQFTFAASGIITAQVKAGAPFDVILLANRSYVDELNRDGRLEPGTSVTYAEGRLAYWSKAGLKWADLETPTVRHIAIANPAHAPYGAAARQVLERTGLWNKLQSKLVYGENVRQALQFAETGNADVVITSWSLLRTKGGELINPDLHAPITQAGAVVATSGNKPQARRFMEFLMGAEGGRILREHGFSTSRR